MRLSKDPININPVFQQGTPCLGFNCEFKVSWTFLCQCLLDFPGPLNNANQKRWACLIPRRQKLYLKRCKLISFLCLEGLLIKGCLKCCSGCCIDYVTSSQQAMSWQTGAWVQSSTYTIFQHLDASVLLHTWIKWMTCYETSVDCKRE